MKKKQCDILSVIILICGIITLPFLKGNFGITDILMSCIVCGTTLALILISKLIGYKTGYSAEEIKEDKINFILQSLMLMGLIIVGFIVSK